MVKWMVNGWDTWAMVEDGESMANCWVNKSFRMGYMVFVLSWASDV